MVSRIKQDVEELDSSIMVDVLIKQKEELEQEFTDILRFILEDMKNQEDVMKRILENSPSDNNVINQYKEQYVEALEQVNKLKKELDILQNKYNKLAQSKLGKITLKYWAYRNRK